MRSTHPAFKGRLLIVVFAFAGLALLPVWPASCSGAEVALLLQQTPAQGGIVSPDIGVHHYAANAVVTLVAVPRPGYQFVYWLGDVLDATANKTTALLSEPKVIVAVFEHVDHDQVMVGQGAHAVGGGGSFSSGTSISPAAARTSSGGSSGGGSSRGSTPTSPTEGDPEPPIDPPDDPPIDPPDDPPIDPPPVPEPATGLMLALGGLALLKRRKA